jgi:hypothetical protein
MFRRSARLLSLTLVTALPAISALVAHPAAVSADPAPSLTLAVADLSGADNERGRFLADSLMTALGQSDKVRLVECSDVRHALAELKLAGSGSLDSEQMRRLGQKLRADLLVVGSYLEQNDHLVINVRAVDVTSGRPAPGCAGSVEGSGKEMLTLVQGLSRQIQDRVGENGPKRISETAKAAPEEAAPPAGPRPTDVVSEGDLAALVTRLARDLAAPSTSLFTAQSPGAPVTRLRALAALVKLIVGPEELAAPAASGADALPPDAAQMPAWGKPFVAAAVEEGWWKADEPLGAREKATWEFVNALVARMPLGGDVAASGGPYSGIIIDARTLNPQRAMGPRILDEDGAVLYPDPKHVHVPSPDELQNGGMVSYTTDEKDPRRAGSRPLVVTAVSITGPAHEDLIVSRDTAQQIREANRRFRFFTHRAVSILIAPKP